jgi:hypothetical protein
MPTELADSDAVVIKESLGFLNIRIAPIGRRVCGHSLNFH